MKTESEVMLHVRANRKLYYAREVIDSSKIKVPGFWGEVLTPSGKHLCGCFVFFTGLSKGTLDFVLELIWKEKFRNLRRNSKKTPFELKELFEFNAYVAVIFFLQLNFILPLFLGMVMYDNEFKTKQE